MARKPKNLREAPSKSDPRPDEDLERSKELIDDNDVEHTLREMYSDIEKGFDNQSDRSNEILDNWDLYNCKLGPKQFYNGNSKIFVPIIHDAVNARTVRFTNQIFPQSGRNVECTTEDGTLPHALMALLDHYVRKAKLRTQIIPAMIRAGDNEGQYTLYVSWGKNERNVVYRGKKKATIEDGEDQLEDPDSEFDDIIEEDIVHQYPLVECISDPDILVLPATSSSLEDALANGGSVTILRRWTKTKIKQLIEDGEIDKGRGESFIKELGQENTSAQRQDVPKAMVDAAGVKKDGRGRFGLIYETWTRINLDGKKKIVRCYFAGKDQILSCKRNPFWSDKLPILSVPVEKVNGSFKGRAKVAPVADYQIMANDAVNEGMDSAAYALMPIVMTDPEKNPRVGSMILSMAAIWETNPNDTKFAEFPPLWKDAFEIVNYGRQQILQTLSVNPASITQGGGKKKLNQAEIAQEQQIDLLTTADAVTVLEEGILTPLLERMIELDHQFRDEDVTIRQYGEMGVRAKMERIEPIQFHRRWQFKWFGVEAARNAQQIQQQIAAMNVLRGIPPQLYKGYELDLVPVVTQLVENAFGPRLAPLVFKDLKSQLSQDPQEENSLMSEGLDMPVHPLDDHQTHMQVHLEALRETRDRHGSIRTHMLNHQAKMAEAMQAAAQQMQPKGGPGAPGGAGPGRPGSPRPGAQPMAPRGGQGPAGMIHHDQMRDPRMMPRRAG